MTQMILDLPVDISSALRIPTAEQKTRLQHELAIRLYQKNLLSFGKARELARLGKWEFHFLLAQEGIIRHYDETELDLDLKTLEELA